MKTNFHNKNFALRLALKRRQTWTRKWPISQQWHAARKTGEKSECSLSWSRTYDLPITSSDALRGNSGKIRVLLSRSRTYDLPITSSNALGGNSGKIRVLVSGSQTYNLPITSSDALRGNSGKIRMLPSRSQTYNLPITSRMLYARRNSGKIWNFIDSFLNITKRALVTVNLQINRNSSS